MLSSDTSALGVSATRTRCESCRCPRWRGQSVQRSGGHEGPTIERLLLSKEGGRAVRGWDPKRGAARYPLTMAHRGVLWPPKTDTPFAGAMLSSAAHVRTAYESGSNQEVVDDAVVHNDVVRAADVPEEGALVHRSGGHAGLRIERLPLSEEVGRAVRGWAPKRDSRVGTHSPRHIRGGLRDFQCCGLHHGIFSPWVFKSECPECPSARVPECPECPRERPAETRPSRTNLGDVLSPTSAPPVPASRHRAAQRRPAPSTTKAA